jgi:adenylate cyclase
VNTQLIDAETDAHIWAERFDYATDDLFALQDEVTSQIAVALDLELISAEAARPTDDPDALDYILRGRAALNRGSAPENFAEAIRLFETALELDPRSAAAQALLARSLIGRVLEQMTDSAAADIARAEALIERALAVSPRHPLAHFAKGQALRAQRRYAAAIPEYETVVALDRNSVHALAALAQCRFLAGAIEEAPRAHERAIRLSPRDPHLSNWYWRIGMVHLLQARTDEALVWLEMARISNPRLPGPHAWLASAHALKGDLEHAAAELAAARRLSGDGRYATIAAYRDRKLLGSPKNHALAETTFFAGLRKAGVPEE